MFSRLILPFLGAALLTSSPAAAQATMDDVIIRATDLGGGLTMLEGRGGNIGLCAGDDGVFMIDDQFAPLTEKIIDAIADVSGRRTVKFLLNTHWHGDHTGGNENLGEAGAVIVAHENVRKRMSTEQFSEVFQRTTPPSPDAALPIVTFADGVTFHFNGEEIDVFHVEHAHTDGDAIVHFKKANVVHMGDVFFSGMFPYIDPGSGGSIEGVIAAIDEVLPRLNDATKIIPGHGPLSTIDDVRAYRAMLVTVHGEIRRLMKEGLSRNEIVAARPARAFEAEWGGGFMKPDAWVGIIHAGLEGADERRRPTKRE